MPKITDFPKKNILTLRTHKSEIEAIDKFYQDWRTISLEQLHFKKGGFKRSGILRLALEEFLERYDLRTAYQEGNAYTVRLNAHEFKPDDMFSVLEKLKELRSSAKTKGEAHLYKALFQLVDHYRTDTFNSGSLKNTYHLQTQRLFVNQWQIKENAKKSDEGEE
jgi:hypothetical protein